MFENPARTLVAFHVVVLLFVVAPFLFWGDQFDALAIEILEGKRASELFIATAVVLAADLVIPVPSSAVSVSAGMLLGAPIGFLACFLGLTLGCVAGYGAGYYFRRYHFNRWHDDHEFRELSMQLSRQGYIILLACRGIPIVAEMSVMVAGFHRYPFLKFVMVTALGNAILAGIYAFVGETVHNLCSIYLLVATFFMIPAITFSVRMWWVGRHLPD